MKANVFNEHLRNSINELIKKGAKRRHICSLILGAQNEPQLESFLSGKEFGIKPLQRILESFGYNLMLVAIPNDSNHEENEIKNMNKKFFEFCIKELEKNLADEKKISEASTIKNEAIMSLVQDIVNKL